MLCESDPYSLGWDLAVGAMSDILACGGTPLFYAHDISVGSGWSDAFVTTFAEGVSRALKSAHAMFIGGDMGQSRDWKYTAAVIGRVDGRYLLRKGAGAGDSIYLSGKVGTGNVNAALSLYSNKKPLARMSRQFATQYPLRLAESALVKQFAACCIDTSDGVFDALNTISDLNGTGYVVENLPYIKKGMILAKILSLPKELMFFGGCGEYELLFTVKEKDETEFRRQAASRGLTFYRLGRILEGNPAPRLLKEKGKTYNAGSVQIDARHFTDVKTYLQELLKAVEDLKCRSDRAE
jgi:thiamine-monophosphate kinase